MARRVKPYIKCEKRDGEYHITIMASGFNGHIPAGRGKVAVDDTLGLTNLIVSLMEKARGAIVPLEKLTDGND